jgi:hypothetical protein
LREHYIETFNRKFMVAAEQKGSRRRSLSPKRPRKAARAA